MYQTCEYFASHERRWAPLGEAASRGGGVRSEAEARRKKMVSVLPSSGIACTPHDCMSVQAQRHAAWVAMGSAASSSTNHAQMIASPTKRTTSPLHWVTTSVSRVK